jgi:hypothetical protein
MKQLALFLILTLAFQTSAFGSDAVTTQQSPQVGNIRTQIQKYAAANKRLRITLRTGQNLKGHISRTDDASFDITDKTGHITKPSYEDVASIHGAGLGTGAKIAITVGCAVAVIAAVIAIGLKRSGY